MDDNKSLIIKNISHFYKDTKSINNFSLSMNKGEVVSIIGPSGCGKTTLLRLISGFENPISGHIKIGKKIVYGDAYVSTKDREVGMLFQDIALFPHLTVGENINFSLSQKKDNVGVINNLLKKVGLEKYIDRYPDTISGGEQQRVALARALARNPRIMLLDEPFASLDTWSKYDIGRDLINILKSSNTSTLMVTHDPQEAMRLSDRILVMLNGSIVDEGSPDELYKNSKHAFSVRLLGAIMDFKNEIKKLIINGLFGQKLLKRTEKYNDYELLVRPDAFTIPKNNEKGFEVEIIYSKNLGPITELTIKVLGHSEVIKILIFSNILIDLVNSKKLFFNKEWAFVFPKS